jgi:hypothetical protein
MSKGAGMLVLLMLACGRREQPPVTTADHVGDQQCLSCHESKATYSNTAHHMSSRVADSGSIAGSFDNGENVLPTSNPYLHFRMDADGGAFYQTAITGKPPTTTATSERFDIVIGSSRKGQSYLYWRDDLLFQLPVSYWTELDEWVNSPDYLEGVVNFNRPATPRCLECHATWFESQPDSAVVNRYDTTTFMLAITCEKCHGPGRQHMARGTSWVSRLLGSAIVNPAELPRVRQLEECGLCHGGVGKQNAPAFSHVPGRPLDESLQLTLSAPGGEVDVHGNQVALLARSRCFQASSTMTCSTCHDVHRPQRNAAEFSPRCLSCHEVEACGLFPVRGPAIAENCVDCHMPELPSSTVISSREGRKVQPRVRTHWIKVYRSD